MPWSPEDAKKHTNKADTENKQKQWAAISNSVLEKCMADGGKQEVCERKAITQANGVIAKLSEEVCDSFYYLTDISDIQLEEKEGKKSSWIEIFRIGKWNHQKYGIIEGTTKLFNDFIDNWKNNVLGRDVAIDKTHEPSDGATGWVQGLKIKGDRLLALIEWTPWGVELIEQKGFKYFSPEYRDSYTDKENGKEYKNVLFGGALTNRPFLTDLAPVVLSEDIGEEVISLCCPVDEVYDKYITMKNDLKYHYINILGDLCRGGLVEEHELRDIMLGFLDRLEYSFSEEIKNDFITCLEEYFEKRSKK